MVRGPLPERERGSPEDDLDCARHGLGLTQSPALTAYARISGAAMVEELAAALRETSGVDDEDTRPDVVASALVAAHGAIFERVRRRVVSGVRVAAAVPDALAAAAPAFDLLEAGLGDDWADDAR